MPRSTSQSRIATPTATPLPLSGIRPKPLLASDALREEVAPERPAERTARRVAGASSVGLVGVAVVIFSGLAGPAPTLAGPGAVAGALLLAILAARIPYRTRAYAMTGAGSVLLLEGLLGHGPAFGLTHGTSLEWEIPRVVAAIVLPAALFFRASYRAYPSARAMLALALVLALPFVVRSGYVIALPSGVWAHVAAGTTIAAVLFGLVGFMGSGTTAMGSAWGALILVTMASDIALARILGGATGGWALHAITSLAFLCGAAVAAVGVFQTAALHLAADARRIDVTRHQEPPDDDDPTLM